MADFYSRYLGGSVMFLRTKGPLTPRRLLLRSQLPVTGRIGAPGGHRQERDPHSNQVEGAPGGHRQERGPHSNEVVEGAPGGHRQERGPHSNQVEGAPGGHRQERGPHSNEVVEGAPGGHRQERGPHSNEVEGAPGGHRQERGPHSNEVVEGAPGGHRQERGPHSNEVEGAPGGHRQERGPHSNEVEWAPGGHRQERGPHSNEVVEGAPGGHRQERGPHSNEVVEGAPGGHRQERGPHSNEVEGAPGGHRQERGPHSNQVVEGAPGGYREEMEPQGGQRVEGSGLPRGHVGAAEGWHGFGDVAGGTLDLYSPLVSSFARTPFPLRIRVAPVDAESLVRAGRLQEVGGPVDRSSALWVNRRQLRVLGLYHREWVWVSLPPDRATTRNAAGQGNKGRHLAMIVAAELCLGHPHKGSPCPSQRDEPTSLSSVSASTAIISATLAFNLTSASGRVSEVLIQRFSTEPTQEGRSALTEPPVARLLHLDVVKSPSYRSDATFQQALCQHFQTPRAVQVGDVLCVSSLSHSEFQLHKASIPVRCPDLYFKVQSVESESECEGYVADTDHTTLYQVGSIHSFIPSFPSRDGHMLWSSLFPAGLSHTVDDICRIFLPHLHNVSDVLETGGRLLLTGPKGSGKATVVRAACSRLNVHLYQVECARLCRDSSASSISRLRSIFSHAAECRPCVLLLHHLDLLGKDRDGAGEDTRVIGSLCSLLRGTTHPHWDLPFLVVSTTSRLQDVPLDLHSCFLHEVSLSAPTEEQRLTILAILTASVPLSRDVDLGHLARRTAGFMVTDLCGLLSRAGRISCSRIRNSCALSEEDEDCLLSAGFPVMAQDLDSALAELQEAHSEDIGAPKVPCVHWTDVGGLEEAKRQLLDTVQFPLEHPEMFTLGLNRSGILLYGPPGTGKTLLAKAVATECAMTFLRVVSQLLAEMDGLHSSCDVFVIGATNRPDLLDPALLRPGRFDRLVYVGLNDNRDSQLRVLEAITQRFSLDPTVDLSHILQYCPPALTGADLYALCADAMMSAIKEKVQRLQEGADQAVAKLVLRAEHLVQAAERLQPSVSQSELQRYQRIHRQFSASTADI
ncbi:peroxisome biogenesis factor 6 isoform X2 [Dendropsophus ebraccatus]|uniref:peroxisome biogenesis factor 6 isoform X2 n=1 Tax=Dendropsophus ebraccatus TaxID=150705 RepID=UPI00383157F7